MTEHTTRVRVKVLINAFGEWAAYGWTTADNNDADDVLYDMLIDKDTSTARAYWLVADIPLPPDNIEFDAQVEDAGDA